MAIAATTTGGASCGLDCGRRTCCASPGGATPASVASSSAVGVIRIPAAPRVAIGTATSSGSPVDERCSGRGGHCCGGLVGLLRVHGAAADTRDHSLRCDFFFIFPSVFVTS